MKTHGYTAEELAGFYAVLDRAVCEAAECELKISIPTMVRRLFAAVDTGERDPDRLADILIGRTPRQAQAA
ncbi:hypothetical protein [Hyphomicrobium sp.]|uniref:hypothetical protein n=1 Tax=Hyphomicrobium sp. TaxID=82 RepID=UPI002D76EDBC|nr:hypothetical protein [Hyphomicrobium sp.]HET6388548.1 hypothetical protein [Hyphomicrobium sp.]